MDKSRTAIAGLMVLFLVVTGAKAESLIRLENADQDTEKELILENSHFRLVIKPSAGGTGVSLRPKPTNTEMLVGQGRRSALMRDGIAQQGSGGDFIAPYRYVITQNTPELASVTLTCRGSTQPILDWIELSRTITIHADKPAINVRVEIENNEDSMRPFKLGYWAQHLVGAYGQENRFFIPRTNGVLELPVTSVAHQQDYWHYEMARGWLAALADDGTGIAFRMKYANLMCGYQWMKKRTYTLEWLTRSQEIPNGKRAVHEYEIMPFAGLTRVDGVADGGVVGEIVFESIPVPGNTSKGHVRLIGSPGELQLDLAWRHADQDEWHAIDKDSLTLGGDSPSSLAFEFTAPDAGLYGIRCVVNRDGKQIGILERAVKLGAAAGVYQLSREAERAGDVNERWIRTIPKPGADGQPVAEGPIDIKDLPDDIPYEMKHFSPHVPWARPYHKGKTRVFILMQTQVGREMFEFAQRLDMQLKTVTFGSTSWKAPAELVRGWSNTAAEMHIKKTLSTEPLDVIVLRTPWWALSESVQDLLVERVKAGTGLVYVGVDFNTDRENDPELFELVSQGIFKKNVTNRETYLEEGFPDHWKPMASHYIAGALPWEEMRTRTLIYEQTTGTPVVAWASEALGDVPMVVVSQFGKGRVACVNYEAAWFPGRSNHLVPSHYDMQSINRPKDEEKYAQNPLRFHANEYAWALLSRCALWAAKRESELYVDEAEVELDDVGINLALTLENQGEAGTLQCELTLRDEDSNSLHRATVPVKFRKGRQVVTVPIPDARIEGALNFVEFRLLNRSGVVDFGAAAIRRPTPTINVKVDRPLGHIGERLPNAIVNITGNVPAESQLIISVEDGNGRVVSEDVASSNVIPGESRFELTGVRNLEIPEYFVRVTLLSNRKVVADDTFRALYEVPVSYDDWLYHVETYQGYFNDWAKHEYQRMRDLGIRGVHTMSNAAHSVLEMRSAGLQAGDITGLMDRWHPKDHNQKIAKYRTTGDVKHLARDPDMNDPAYRARQKQKIQNLVPLLRALGIWDNTIIDEYDASSNADYSFAEPTLVKFREWVQTQYKDLAELNDAYGREYQSWDEVLPLTIEQAREIGKFAGWVDHRRFMELSTYEYWSWVGKELRKVDPNARISLSGTQIPNAYNGHDVWLRCKVFDGVWSYHLGHQDRMMRSFGARRKPNWFDFTWTGYAQIQHRYYHWKRAVRAGTTGAAYWWFIQTLNPDWQVSESARAGLAATRQLREGAGRILMELPRHLDTSGIAIHYSQASAHCAYARNAFPAWSNARNSWVGALRTLGWEMDFIAYEQVEKGELTYPKYKVLVLPYSIAMSDQEIAGIRAFVESGGTVIADLQTAATDTHSRPRIPGGLDDVFGIRHINSDLNSVRGDFRINPPADWRMPSQPLDVNLAEQAVTLAGGEALLTGTRTPGFVRHQFGKGHAYYLNLKLNLNRMRRDGTAGPMLDAVDAILNEAGAARPIEVIQHGSKHFDHLETYYYPAGDQHYLVLLTQPNKQSTEPIRCTVTLPRKFFAHEMVEGQDYGETAKLDLAIPPDDARFFALLPRKTTTLQATITPTIKQGGKAALSFEVKDGGDAGLRVVRVTVTDPNGKPVHRLEDNYKTDNGVGRLVMPFALNDPVGAYTVNLREVATGLTRQLAFDVTPAERILPEPMYEKYAEPSLPTDQGLWRGKAGQHIPWDGKSVELAPLPLGKSILKNPTLLDLDEVGTPAGWHVQVRRDRQWLTGPDTADYLRISKDDKVQFRGRPTTQIELGDPEYPDWRAYWRISQHIREPQLGALAGKTVRLRFFSLRTGGPDKPREYDAILRVRVQPTQDSGYHQWPNGRSGADAIAIGLKNVWTEASTTITLPETMHSMDVALFGKFNDTLRFHGFLFEIVDD